jgi:multiple sugar transport system substrate-binding protein
MQRVKTSGGRGGANLSRKEFLRLGGAGLAGAAMLGVAGCGGGGGGGAGSNAITFSWGPEETGTLQKVIDRFNEENEDGITVNYREMPADTGQYFDQLRTEFQAGGGDIDVIGADVIWPAQLAANGWLLDLSDRFPEEERQKFLKAPMEACTWEGKPYAVPWYTDSGMLYYRRDLLEQSGFSEPPKTWEELKEMAQKVQQDSGTKMGFVFQGAEYEGGVCNELEYVWTHGGNALAPNDPNKVVIGSPESAAAFATARSMIEDGVAPQSVVNYKEQESQTAFLNGNSVFMRNWPYIYALAAEEGSKVKQDQIGVAPIPAGGPGNQSYSTLGGWNFAINANSQNPDAAWSFVQYMAAPEQQRIFAVETARIPTLTSLLENEEVAKAVPVIPLAREAIDRTRPRPVSPYYSDMSLKLAEQFNSALKGDVSPEQAVKTLQQEMEQIVEQGQS